MGGMLLGTADPGELRVLPTWFRPDKAGQVATEETRSVRHRDA
ncbi:hypothetical protein [Streptomyces sp. HUCO-GS316]|nr:hypothetical protein [Streptomyces sp. HUCO-GS316]